MRDIVQQWKGVGSGSKFSLEPAPGAVTRYIKFVWCLNRLTSITWFALQLDKVAADVKDLRSEGHDIAVDLRIYITCVRL